MSKPSIRELIDDSRNGPADGRVFLMLPKDREAFDVLMARAHAGFLLAERVERVLALHKESDSTYAKKPWCSTCKDADGNHVDWPCATVRLLNGEDK
jgi:hypothetical protein